MAGHKDDRLLSTLFANILRDADFDEDVKNNTQLQIEVARAKDAAAYLYNKFRGYNQATAELQTYCSGHQEAIKYRKHYEAQLKALCESAIKIDAAHNEYPKLKAFAYTLAAIALVLIVTAGILTALPAAGGSLFAAALAWSGLTAFVGGSVTTAAGVAAGIGLLFSIALGGVAAGLTSEVPKDITLYSAIDDFINKVCAETGIKKTIKPQAYYCFWSQPIVEIQGSDFSCSPPQL